MKELKQIGEKDIHTNPLFNPFVKIPLVGHSIISKNTKYNKYEFIGGLDDPSMIELRIIQIWCLLSFVTWLMIKIGVIENEPTKSVVLGIILGVLGISIGIVEVIYKISKIRLRNNNYINEENHKMRKEYREKK